MLKGVSTMKKGNWLSPGLNKAGVKAEFFFYKSRALECKPLELKEFKIQIINFFLSRFEMFEFLQK